MADEKTLTWAELQEQLEEEKRRKERAFLTYMKMAKDAAHWKELLNDRDEKGRRQLVWASIMANYLKETLTIHEQLQKREENIRNFFTQNETQEQAAQRKELLNGLHIKDTEFFSLALASQSEKAGFSEKAMDIFRGKDAFGEGKAELRENGLHFAEAALRQLQSGRVEWLEALLISGLQVGCQQFANTRDPLHAMHWARHINSILGIINTHKVLFRDGLQDPLLTRAVECAAIGKVMESGYDALMEIQHAAMMGEPLTHERNLELTSRVLLMQNVDVKRTSLAVSPCFPAKFNPRDGFPAELFQALEARILSSETFHEITKLSPENHALFLSGHATRDLLSHRLSRELDESVIIKEKAPSQKEPPQVGTPSLFK